MAYASAPDLAYWFTQAIGAVLDERILDWEVRIDGHFATVWAKYDSTIDGEFNNCGIESAQLFRMADGWKIVHMAGSSHSTRSDCPWVTSSSMGHRTERTWLNGISNRTSAGSPLDTRRWTISLISFEGASTATRSGIELNRQLQWQCK